MRKYLVISFLLLIVDFGLGQDDSEMTTEAQLKEGEKKMSQFLLQILEHYKRPDPVGIPGVEVPEPYPVPDTRKTTSMYTFDFRNMGVYGLRDFQVKSLDVELQSMEVRVEMAIKKIQARGNYTLTSWITHAQGPFTVDVFGLRISAQGSLTVQRDGKIRLKDIEIDVKPEDIAVDFQNLGLAASVLQSIVNSLGTVIFDGVKPIILKEAYEKARVEIDKQLEEVAGNMQFPNSISPLDMVIADVRKKLSQNNIDPYKIKDYNGSLSIFTIALSRIWISGISTFHRVGNITLKMENNTVIADFEVGTQKLEGTASWLISAVGGLVYRSGTASFTVDYISGRLVLAQSMDTRETPKFRDLQLEAGNIQVRCDGIGTLDYVIESLVNILPNLLRYQIVDAIERPMKEKFQLELNRINVEELIKQQLPIVHEVQETGFNLTALVENTDVPKDEVDDFFNF